MRLLAVGDRQPDWVDDAVAAYLARLPRDWRFRLETVATGRRGRNDPPERAVGTEAGKLLARIAPGEQAILLDERGTQLSSKNVCERVLAWQADGRDICFIIGGPDGVAATVRERADFLWSLSPLTLPHGLARILLVEQLYRAWSLGAGHPYHRE